MQASLGPLDYVISAYSTHQHLLLDLDAANYASVLGVARLIQREWPQVHDGLIVRSSGASELTFNHKVHKYTIVSRPERESYHLVFDGKMTYEECTEIIRTLARLDVLAHAYVFIRDWRGDMSLRISAKNTVMRRVGPPVPIQLLPAFSRRTGERMLNRYLTALSTYQLTARDHLRTPLTPPLRAAQRPRPRTLAQLADAHTPPS